MIKVVNRLEECIVDFRKFFDNTYLKGSNILGGGLERSFSFNRFFSFELKEEFKELYYFSNGQNVSEKGVFKAVSGYDKYSRLIFLPVEKVRALHNKLMDDMYESIFEKDLIPFASEHIDGHDDTYCYHNLTGEVYLLWILAADLFNPIEWELYKVKYSNSLSEFFDKQNELYL